MSTVANKSSKRERKGNSTFAFKNTIAFDERAQGLEKLLLLKDLCSHFSNCFLEITKFGFGGQMQGLTSCIFILFLPLEKTKTFLQDFGAQGLDSTNVLG